MTENFAFPADWDFEKIITSIVAAQRVNMQRGDINWKTSTFTLEVAGARQTISADALVGLLVDQNIGQKLIEQIFRDHNFAVGPTAIIGRMAVYRASKITKPPKPPRVTRQRIQRQAAAAAAIEATRPRNDRFEQAIALQLDIEQSLPVKNWLMHTMNLTPEEYTHLPSQGFLAATVIALMLSSVVEIQNAAALQMQKENAPVVELKDEQTVWKMAVVQEASFWHFRFMGLTDDRNPRTDAAQQKPDKPYEALLTELIKFWRGENRSNQFLTALDQRMARRGTAFTVTRPDPALFPDPPSTPQPAPSGDIPEPNG